MKLQDLAGLWKQSLKTRVTVVTLLLFMTAIWVLTGYAGKTLRADMQRLLTASQLSTVSMAASQINAEIATRKRAMELVASSIRPEHLASPKTLQKELENYPVFAELFSGGAFVTGLDGVALASIPSEIPRVGQNYSDRDYFRTAVQEGTTSVGRPLMGRLIKKPVFVLSTPIRDSAHRIVGMLAAGIDLGKPSFMDRVSEQPFSRSGSYLVVSRTYRQIVVSSDKRRTLEVLPKPGVNPTVDRFVNGQEGDAIFVNPVGVEVLTAVKAVPEADWYVAVAMPTVEAFAPIRRLQERIVGVAALLTLLAGGLIWLVVRRELRPLQSTAQALKAFTDFHQTPQPLPVKHPDEIGQVVTSFNLLLMELVHRQKHLAESETRYRIMFQISPDAMALSRLSDGLFLDVNNAFTRLLGWSHDDLVGHTALELGIWVNLDERSEGFVKTLERDGHLEAQEYKFRTQSGNDVTVRMSASCLLVEGVKYVLAIMHDMTSHQIAQQQIQQLETLDALTGLPNRKWFTKHMAHSIASATRYRRHGALLYVNLDDFKTLNETQGHDQGDAMLKTVAARLCSCVEADVVVARIGGDEFCVVLDELDADPSQAADAAEKVALAIHAAMLPPFLLSQGEYRIGCCIGITLFGETAEHAGEPLKRADLALYQAKASGRNQTYFYEPQMQAQVNARALMESSLRHAIEQGQLQLHYQTQVDSTGVVHGVEALVRWSDPRRGLVSPGEFIPLAESSGLIVPLGQWVLETACAQLADWSHKPEMVGLTVAVNVSLKQFRQADFVDRVLLVLRLTGADPRRLKLELTESILAADIHDVISKMNALRALGVRFALDDFGTGFSSLAYLKRLPLDQLKIDQGFVRDILIDPNDMAIAKMVVALGDSLGLSVIAEGVETVAQKEALAGLGCKHYQGYLFGRPVPADALETHILGR